MKGSAVRQSALLCDVHDQCGFCFCYLKPLYVHSLVFLCMPCDRKSVRPPLPKMSLLCVIFAGTTSRSKCGDEAQHSRQPTLCAANLRTIPYRLDKSLLSMVRYFITESIGYKALRRGCESEQGFGVGSAVSHTLPNSPLEARSTGTELKDLDETTLAIVEPGP